MTALQESTLWKNICSICREEEQAVQNIQVMAVSKGQSTARIAAAVRAGYRLFGESRVQEAMEKFRDIRSEVQLHLIGTLQRNKVRKAVEFFDCIQSVDSLRILQAIARTTEAAEKPLTVMLEVHTAEVSKGGFRHMDELVAASDFIAAHSFLHLEGLMTIAPHTRDSQKIDAAFAQVQRVHKILQNRIGPITHLSMGMSDDYPRAIAQGATMLRLGRSIFDEAYEAA